MQIAEGSIGRVLVLRFEEGEKLPEAIERVALEKKIESAIILLLGGVKRGKLVVGPKKTVPNPKVVLKAHFAEGREMLGIGTIFKSSSGHSLHMHIASGRGRTSLTGCIRLGVEVYLIAEAVIIELVGINAERVKDIATGFNLLTITSAAKARRKKPTISSL